MKLAINSFQIKRHVGLKVKAWKKTFRVNINEKKAWLKISDKIDLKKILKDKLEHYLNIMG